MPHKHKRRRGQEDVYELPPSQKALPLSVAANKKKRNQATEQPDAKRLRKDRKNDDAPRAFRRLMRFAQGKKTRSGLDDEEASKSKQSTQEILPETPRIKPGEDMRSFSARVDAALPIAGLATKTKTKDGKDSLGLKVHRTRKEKKMHKLYDQWRAEERKIQEQKEEEQELAEEHDMDSDTHGMFDLEGADQLSGDKKPRKRGKAQDDDPWRELIRKRGEVKVGLHDVAQAPPELPHRKSRKTIQVSGAVVDIENIPKAAGSLHRREQLQTVRNEVLEAYRKIREHEQAKLDARRDKA